MTGLGGHVLKKLGDGLMALFGYPQAQENDAERAVRAALAIQRALADLNARNARSGAPELAARIGIECGSVVVDASGEVFGEAPNVAARVQAAAEPGMVLVTGSVQRQTAGLFVVEDKGEHELKGVPQPVTLYRILRASGGGRRGGARVLTPLVGREDELFHLMRRWTRANEGEGQFVQIVGEPGLGKSRLIEEFRAKLTEAPHTWVEWASSQLLQNTPLHPIAEWGRQRFGGPDIPGEKQFADLESALGQVGLDAREFAPLLAPLFDIPTPGALALAPEEFRRRQLAAMVAWFLAGARTQPVALAVEDLHWADPTSLDLLRALVERSGQAPLMILATARPEFRAPWTMRSHHSVIALAPLDRAQVRRMVGEIAASHALPADVIDSVGERTGGVPLFVEEVTRLLLERGAGGGVQTIPPTLQQSLAARLDRLGEAREVAQIGAVLGREFTYGLLHAVASVAAVADPALQRGAAALSDHGYSDTALQSALDRLVEADLLFVEGAAPAATYRFKHALIQDAAYESLLKSRRQALHRRAANALLAADAEPEAIAHHFTEAGLDDAAIEWWGKAGDQALRRSAFSEAIAHLAKAIAMADKAADLGKQQLMSGLGGSSQRSKLQSDYARAVMWSRGYAAEETRAAFARASELGGQTENATHKFAAYYLQWVRSHMRAEHRLAQATAETFLREAEEGGYVTEAIVARRAVGSTCLAQGNLVQARTYLQRAVDEYVPAGHTQARFHFGQDPRAAAAAYLALTAWHLGQVERARRLAVQAVQLAAELGHVPTSANAHSCEVILEARRNDPAAALRSAEVLLALVQGRRMDLYVAAGEAFVGWAHGRLYDAQAGAEQLRKALASYLDQGNKFIAPTLYGLLAELEAVTRGPDGALTLIDQGLAMACETGERFSDPYLCRLRANILLKRNPDDPAAAEETYQTAIAIAKEQGARSYELLASLSLARLYQATARPAEAHAVLAPALEGFSPTLEMPEIAEAAALLATLSQTDDVKAQVAQRQRLTQLHVAQANALFAARGYGAPETTEAFARARESASGDKDAPGRLAADYGLWVGSYARGDLPSMRAHSAAFLSDVEARPDSPEAGVAHRAAGITCWVAGEYREARDHLERALALFQPGRDNDLAFRFGLDPGVAAMFSLAVALWPLGEVDRAVSLVEQMLTQIADLTHVGTLAVGRLYATLFELMRGDRTRAAPNAFELGRLAREHELSMYGAVGAFLGGWVAAAGGAPGGGLEDMRRGVDLLREQNVLFYDGLLKTALAEAEARAGDLDRAVAILDEALATCDRTGYRAFEAELHRARGEILLKRDPANPAPAEDAFLSAIAVAKQQGTRSFGLRAALSLAKLYHSTGRPADAHAVLAPALEGFAPTPEMPEIAEAQALLAG